MQILTFGRSYSGIGPDNFNKRQLFELLKMRQKAGRKLSKSFTLSSLKDISKTTLINEAKRVRTPNTWSFYFFNINIMKYGVPA